MKKSIITLLFLSTSLIVGTVSAQSNSQLISEIVELTRAIRDEATTSNASTETLRQVRNKMEDALIALRQGSGHDGKNECFQFAFEKYNFSNSSSVATDKALQLCQRVMDVPVLKFAFEKYNFSNSSEGAITKAGNAASLPLRGKLDMVQFAFEKYNFSNASDAAITKATNGIAQVSYGSMECLKTLFIKYNVSNSSEIAMDKTIQGCR